MDIFHIFHSNNNSCSKGNGSLLNGVTAYTYEKLFKVS